MTALSIVIPVFNERGNIGPLVQEVVQHLRGRTHLVLVCGQGAWEDQCIDETIMLAELLASKGISHERDLWGHDVEHHWHWWRKQIAFHFEKALG